MTKHNLISMGTLALGLALTVPAVAAQNVITAEQVAAALNGAGLTTSVKQVVLLTEVVASTNAPTLKIESMQQWSDHETKVRLSCVKPQECLPFFVAIRGSQAQAVSPLLADHSSVATLRAKSDSGSLAVHAGSREVLRLEGGHVHIQMYVVCLENGSVGQTIRVSSLDHKQTYLAEVDSGQMLRGTLQ
jgi:hypothetical protein